jgi:hypothetical protein
MYEEARPTHAVEVFSALEKLHYSVASKRPDVELSLEVIDHCAAAVAFALPPSS